MWEGTLGCSRFLSSTYSTLSRWGKDGFLLKVKMIQRWQKGNLKITQRQSNSYDDDLNYEEGVRGIYDSVSTC